jgi:alpha-1,2-mannosyltransferase
VTVFAHLLRSGDFLTRERVRLWTIALLIGFGATLIVLAVTAHGVNDYHGRPLATDFSDVYAAGVLADQGHAAAAFDPPRHYKQEQAIFGHDTPFYGWHYPPFFLLIAAPLAHLPYLPAVFVWQFVTLALCFAAMMLLLRNGPAPRILDDKIWLLVAFAFPAAFVNLLHGHNGFLTVALLASALAVLDTRPLIAGVLFGLLAYKPQFGVTIPLVLAATGRWKTFASAAAAVAILAALVTVIFGANVWPAFLAGTHFTRETVLEQGGAGFFKIQTVFAYVRMWGGPAALAYAVQATVSIVVAVVTIALWRSGATMAQKGAALCIAMLLVTPYALDYDMMVLAPAVALLASDGFARGFRPYERALIATLWFMPFVARVFVEYTNIPLGVLVMLIGLGFVVRNGLSGQPSTAVSGAA